MIISLPMLIIRFLLFPGLSAIFLAGCPSPPNDNDGGEGNGETPKRDYVWSIDTMFFDTPGISPPDQVSINAIWGSSSHDVWAVGNSDIPWGQLWHYDGKKWTSDKKWSVSGIDSLGTYIVYTSCVTGFDSVNVFVACTRFYDEKDTVLAMVLKWNGSQWIDVPWQNSTRVRGGLGWIVPQGNNKLWATSAAGYVVKYEGGILSMDSRVTDYRLLFGQIAALNNGLVYVNAFKDSLRNDTLQGTITKLYQRSTDKIWSLLEQKFIAGSDYDGNGLGRGVYSVGDRLFTGNRGIWERTGNSWTHRNSIYAIGGECLIAPDNIWFYFNQELWHYNGKDWKQIIIPLLQNYSGGFLYGRGWSNNKEIFLSLHYNGKTYIVHGR